MLDAAGARSVPAGVGRGPAGAGLGPVGAAPVAARVDSRAAAVDSRPAAARHNSGESAPESPGRAGTGPKPGGSPELWQQAGEHRGRLVVSDLRVRDLPPVSFAAEPGTITLIEGPSGAGKSSLLAALRGAVEFDGAAELGGVDVRDLGPARWLAWAGQRPQLSRGTIAQNVALGDAVPDADSIRRALEDACATDLDPAAELGVQGSGLSGGQAQRVAVARALYRQAADPARILALDEPSSALDAETESRLWRSLRARADAGATIVLVSHRRSARVIADQVVGLGVRA
ncbi:ATP-binding cassette domain-containing protein [Microbacterium sp. SD291]|nr:ATP-binding cassette domain-containing protein [Microbacterium sp. SD291]